MEYPSDGELNPKKMELCFKVMYLNDIRIHRLCYTETFIYLYYVCLLETSEAFTHSAIWRIVYEILQKDNEKRLLRINCDPETYFERTNRQWCDAC
jgi:hypothetical protein